MGENVQELGWVPDRDLAENEREELERLRKKNAVSRMERDFATSIDLVREGIAVKYAAIADWAADEEYSVTFMCAQLGLGPGKVAPSGVSER